MEIINKGITENWLGCWPARRNSRRVVTVLAGTAHSGLDEVGGNYLYTRYNRVSQAEYDYYRLPDGVEVKATRD